MLSRLIWLASGVRATMSVELLRPARAGAGCVDKSNATQRQLGDEANVTRFSPGLTPAIHSRLDCASRKVVRRSRIWRLVCALRSSEANGAGIASIRMIPPKGHQDPMPAPAGKTVRARRLSAAGGSYR